MTEPEEPTEPEPPTGPRGSWPGVAPVGEPAAEAPAMPPLSGSGPVPPPRFPPEPPERWPTLVASSAPAVPAPPPPPVPRPAGGADRRWVPWIAAAVVIALVAAVAVVLTRDDRDDEVATDRDRTEEATDTASSTDPSTESSSSSSSESDEFDAVIADIKAFVERERGLEFKEDVEVRLAGEGEFQQLLFEDFAEELPSMVELQQVLIGLGLADPDLDVEAEMRTLLGIGVVGFYDPTSGELVVRGTETGPYVRQVIAHELVHALDDQHFELDRPDLDAADNETGFGFTSLVEGNARTIEETYAESLSADEQQQALDEQFELQASSIDELLSIPPVLIEVLQVPYEEGPKLVDAILDDGGQARLDEAFSQPPLSSEQVLDPDRYLAGEIPVVVAEPAADATPANKGALGQFLIELALDDRDATEGWGGDAYVTWIDGEGRTCLRAIVVGDTPTDTDELATAFQQWAPDQGATVEAVAGQSVTLTACH